MTRVCPLSSNQNDTGAKYGHVVRDSVGEREKMYSPSIAAIVSSRRRDALSDNVVSTVCGFCGGVR